MSKDVMKDPDEALAVSVSFILLLCLIVGLGLIC
jgi:hypothetical protein